MSQKSNSKKNNLTLIACYIGYIIQAIVNNLSPLLFVQYSRQFDISTNQLSLIVLINFGLQIIIDSVSPQIIEKVGYRVGAIGAQLLSALGLICLSTLPFIISPYIGILLATFLMAISGGFIEVIISPVVDALPIDNKSGSMSLLHSFYCWGHILTVLSATLYFNMFGISAWRWLPLILSIIPIINCSFFAKCPLYTLKGDENPVPYKKIFTAKRFWIFPIIIMASGAAEQAIAQWASIFAEMGLGVDKNLGDLAGTCLFAVFMAASRTVYGFFGDKLNLKKIMLICGVGLTIAYLITALSPLAYVSLGGIALAGLFVGILWPGIYSIAGREFPLGGTRMFGILALFGDIGCTIGPSLTGIISSNIKIGIFVSTIFPILVIIGSSILLLSKKKNNICNTTPQS